MTGKQYADRVAHYLVKNFGSRGLKVYREVFVGRTIIGRERRVDILAILESERAALAIECKYQESTGTTDEKIPYALQDLQSMPMPVCLVYGGNGFSQGILHQLTASPIAACCLPGEDFARTDDTRELDVRVAMAFQWWDVLVQYKQPVGLD